ncbi:hypothetical protein EV715DRAFT_293976 [Schizophyllum commune]
MRNATPGFSKSCNAKDHDTHKFHTTKSSTSSFLTSFIARLHRLDASVRASIALTNEVTDRQNAIKSSIATGGLRISDLEDGLRAIITDYSGAAKQVYELRVALNEHAGAIGELGTRLAQLSVQEIHDTVDSALESTPTGDGHANDPNYTHSTDHAHLEEEFRALRRHRLHASDEQHALYSRLARSEGQADQGFVELEAAMDTWLARWRKEAAEARERRKMAEEDEERKEEEEREEKEEREWRERAQRDRQDKEVLEMIATEMAREREAWARARADVERETAQMALEADEVEKRMNARPERKQEEARNERREAKEAKEAKEEAKEMNAKWKAKEEARKEGEKAKEKERKKDEERKKEDARRTEIREALQKAEERKKEEEQQKEEERKKEKERKKEEERKDKERRKKEKAARKEDLKAKSEKNAEKEREKRARRERERKDLSPESRARYDEQAVLIDRYDAAKEKEEAEQRAFVAGVPPLTPPTTPMPTPASHRDVPNRTSHAPSFVPPASFTPTQPAPARHQPQRASSTAVPPASSTPAQPAILDWLPPKEVLDAIPASIPPITLFSDVEHDEEEKAGGVEATLRGRST